MGVASTGAAKLLALAALAAVTATLAACGGGSGDRTAREAFDGGGDSTTGAGFAGPPGVPGAPGPGAFASATPAPAPTPAASGRPPDPPATGEFDDAGSGSASLGVSLNTGTADGRIIIRTVDVGLVVPAVAPAIEALSTLATGSGGWVVSSSQEQRHIGFLSFRVPAEGLDSTLEAVRAIAVEVEFERSTSQDVTDEFTDVESRITSLEATEATLLGLFDSAGTVEDAIRVQTELSRVQQDLESLQGRLNLLAQTSAFSLVRADLRAEPSAMTVDAGPDLAGAVGLPVTFRATLTPPEGIDEFSIEWDFGDGTNPVRVFRTAPTLVEGERITAAVSHAYSDDKNSPFVVTVEITGTGEAGVAEGEDTLIATVSRIPPVEVFAGESRLVEEGDRVAFSGTFTRPAGLEDLTFTWDFGDGSAPVEGALPASVTTATAGHRYENARPSPYVATLTVTGSSAAGDAEGRSSVSVFVEESEGWVVADRDVGETFKDSVRSLSEVGVGALRGAVWVAAFSPLWLGGFVVVYLGVRWRRRSRY